jgi:hypothetical protein
MLLAGMSGTGRRCRRTRPADFGQGFLPVGEKNKFLAEIIKRACPTTPHLIGMATAARSFHGIPEATGKVVPDNPQRCVWALAGCIASADVPSNHTIRNIMRRKSNPAQVRRVSFPVFPGGRPRFFAIV